MPPMTSGIICKLVRVPAGFELVFWLLFLKATGGGVVLMFKIYSRVYFEKQKLIFFFYRKVISLNYCLLQILKKNILFIHFESHKYLTGKRDYDKSPLYDRCSWKLHWKKKYPIYSYCMCINFWCIWIHRCVCRRRSCREYVMFYREFGNIR